MHSPVPLTRDLVLVGGGHAHALLLRRWGMRPVPGVRVTVVNPGPTAPYSGMLPGHIAGHYDRAALEIDLVRLARYAGARLITDRACGLDRAARQVLLQDRGPVGYDLLSLDIGITADMPDLPGFADHAVGAKPMDRYAARWRGFLEAVRAGQAAPVVAVIGGGVAGAELAMAMGHALRKAGTQPQIALIEAQPDLAGLSRMARRGLHRALAQQDITLHFGSGAARVTADAVELADGTIVPAALTVGAAGARPQPWLRGAGLPLTDGFIDVTARLHLPGDESIFAVGDCAHLTESPRPKAGVFAVRAAPVLCDNLRAALSGGRMRPFQPQRRYLKLVSLGGRRALAERGALALSGAWLWRWKDRIDRKFMDRFAALPAMRAPALPSGAAQGVAELLAERPLCGGCGAKVGGNVLAEALAGLPASGRADILSGPGDDAAVLDIAGARQVLSTDHLRAFTEDPALLARIAALHALGDIWAMGAAPQAALASIVLPRMTPALQRRTLHEVMQAAGEVFARAGAAIIGGHTTMGAEMTIGFTVTGLCDGAPILQSGARPGDALLLTRPIGTGVLLAAEMAGQADGRDIAALLDRMGRPQDDAARILRGAHAMTDVTGFGLAGHLLAICRASSVAAWIDPEAVPLYPGALALAGAGQRSTLFEANRDAAPVAGAAGARGDLMFDPQTAGGFLAAVAPQAADALLDALQAAGHEARRIGGIEAGAPAIRAARAGG